MTSPIQISEIPVEFLDNPLSPILFATGTSGVWLHANTVQVTFETARVAHGVPAGPINRVVVGTLVMPVEAAQALAVMLFNFLSAHGISPPGFNANNDRMQ